MNVQVAGALGLAAIIICLPTISLTFVYLMKRLHAKERLAAIEKGITIVTDPAETAGKTRRTGLVLVAAGCAIAVGSILIWVYSREGSVVYALILSILPLFIGGGLLLDYRLQKQSMNSGRL
jgi:hypothetical protein